MILCIGIAVVEGDFEEIKIKRKKKINPMSDMRGFR